MLPTTGYFKSFNCPFYEACICERPYCHFKHSKRDNANDANFISELVSKAVHKVLSSNLSTSDLQDSAAEEQTPPVSETENGTGEETGPGLDTATGTFTRTNVTYNPTPISELNKYKGHNNNTSHSEKKSRHIPIQYTPERPRPFRSSSSSASYGNSLEYVLESCTSEPAGYSPTTNVYTSSVSYIPSSIKALTSNPSASSNNLGDALSSIENKNQPYVPSNSNSDSIDSHCHVKYSPTRNIKQKSQDSAAPSNEIVPKYNDEFLDEFLNDPNIYESTETCDIASVKDNSQIDSITLTTAEPKNIKENVKAVSDTHKNSDKSKKSSRSSSSKSSSSKTKAKTKTDKTDRRSSSSKHSSKDKHVHRVKENENSHQCDRKRKSSSEKHNRHKSKSSSSDQTVSNHKHSSKSKSSSNCSSSSNKLENATKRQSSKHRKSSEEETTSVKRTEEDDDTMEYIDDVDFSDNESDDSTLEQCKRIFDEYKPPVEPVPTKTNTDDNLKTDNHDDTAASTSKKRIAHDKSLLVTRDKAPNTKAKPVKNAAMIMTNRYKVVLSNLESMQQSSTSDSSRKQDSNTMKPPVSVEHVTDTKRAMKRTTAPITPTNVSQDASYVPPGKIKRIAHVPNVSLLLNAKKKVEEIVQVKDVNKTPIQTLARGGKRVAHVPDVSLADIPSVLQAEKSKLPVNIRSKYLFLMVKECAKLYISKQAAYERALNEELNCYSKCSAITTYRNSVMLCINRLRKEAEAGIMSGGCATSNDNASEFSGKKLYENLIRWALSPEELLENGFPRPGAPKKGQALFKESKICEKIPENCQLCIRCKKIYHVDEDGYALYPEDCVYHPGSRFVFRGETKYICCKEPSSAGGCCICNTHVYETKDLSTLSGFMTTFEPEHSSDSKSIRVYALDCEMVYTTRGFELARVTVIDHKCDVVYETMVKPIGDILDCNTRFSGLTTEMLKNVSTRITDVQATLLLMFNSKTILIGHSLESDLKALRLIHSTVVDTSVLFPHKMGPPKKRGLRALASDYLKKIIQNDEGGHDSAEDAITCMELVIWKLKEELKTR